MGGNKVESKPGGKKKLTAYFWWLFGGLFGAHHFYLGRDDHGIIWLLSFGGYFGIGWIRDLFKIPTYVADANDEPKYVEWLKDTIRKNKKPPFSMVRFTGQMFVSFLWGELFYIAIPEDEIYGFNWKQLMIFIPAVIAFGVWLVGNVGREQGSIWIPLATAYVFYPTLYYIGDDTTWIWVMVIASCWGFDSFSKKWRLQPKKKQSLFKRAAIVLLAALAFSSLWCSYFYFNATVTDSEGEEIKLSDAIKHMLKSPIWLDLKNSFYELWVQAKHQGFWATWSQIIDLSDPRGEINAYKVLGLSQTASQSEVTAKWRTLSRENHPDKIKGSEEKRREAQEKFMEIQQAYEILSAAKNRRNRKNRKTAN